MMRLAFLLAVVAAGHLPQAGQAQPTCRVLINVEDGVGHRVADVTLTNPPQVRVVPGLALGSGASVTQVRRVRGGLWAQGLDVRFASLVASDGKADTTWIEGRQELEKPLPGEAVAPWYADFTLEVVGIFGPRISVYSAGYGFLGGAHDFDSRQPRTLLAPGGTPVDVATWLGTPYLDAARARIDAERTRRDDGWEGGPHATPETLKNAVVALQPREIKVETAIDCCSWAENHNYHDLTLTLPVPADLGGLVPDADGWFDTGTCAIRVKDGAIESRGGRVGSLPGRLLGIAWIDPAAPALSRRPPNEAARKAALTRARALVGKAEDATVLAMLETALDADPEHAETLGEIGYLHLKAGRLEPAAAFTQRALEGVEDAELDGRLRYNLGRIAQAQGDLERARRLFKSSLARRPNPTVQKALAEISGQVK